MANIANGSVEVISADKDLKEDIKQRIKDTPSFHFDGEAYVEIGDASIICAFTGKNSVIDAWDFFESLSKDDDYQYKSALLTSVISGYGYEAGAREASQIYKPSGYPDVTTIDISDELDWDNDEYYPYETRGRYEIEIRTFSQRPSLFQYASDELKADKEVVMALVIVDEDALELASDQLKADKEVVLAATNFDGLALQYASNELKADKEVVLVAVNNTGYALEFAADELKADKKVVTTAVSNAGDALAYASHEFKADKEVVMLAVSNVGYALAYADDAFKADKEVVMAAVNSNGYALDLAADQLKADKEVVMAAVNNDEDALEFVSAELREKL